MKEGEIAVVADRVIRVLPLALTSYDLRGLFQNTMHAIVVFHAGLVHVLFPVVERRVSQIEESMSSEG